jgi:hypothetical protein
LDFGKCTYTFYSHIKINNKNYLLHDIVYEAPESKHKKQKTNPVYCTRPTVKMEIDEPLKLLQKAEQ